MGSEMCIRDSAKGVHVAIEYLDGGRLQNCVNSDFLKTLELTGFERNLQRASQPAREQIKRDGIE